MVFGPQVYIKQTINRAALPRYPQLSETSPKMAPSLITKHKPGTSLSIHSVYHSAGQQTSQNKLLHPQQPVHFMLALKLLQASNHCIICPESLVISFVPLNYSRTFPTCYLIPQPFNQFSLYRSPVSAFLCLLSLYMHPFALSFVSFSLR